MNAPLAALLRDSLHQNAQRTALTLGDGHWSYQGPDQQSARLAGAW